MNERLTALIARFTTRRCRGCDNESPHTAHLTWFGRWRYTR